METYQAMLLTLAGVLVGALLPVLFELARTLRDVRKVAAQAVPAVASITATAERLDRLTARFEQTGSLDRSVSSLSQTMDRLQEAARVAATMASAVLPAVSAALQAWRDAQSAGDTGADGLAATDAAPAPEVKP